MDELLGSRCTPATRGAWLKEKWPELLDAHYQCQVPGPSACLQDALNMITTGKVRITCPGAKKGEGKEARTMSELSSKRAFAGRRLCLHSADRHFVAVDCLGFL